MTDLTGRELGNYRIFQDIGHGGMATVYRAYDTENDRVVALKVLSPYIAQEPKFKARFAQEIKVLLELRHPHIVPVYDYGEVGEFAYIVMPFMNAGTLFQRLWEGPLPLDAASDLLHQISGALDYVHANGVVHRDIKPSNILIDDDGNAMLTDFGFARVDDNSLSITGSGIVGTPMYMSPEQCRGEEASPLSDQYAFGVILYQMTTGRLPYDGDTPLEILIKQATDPLIRPREINPDLPRQVEKVLLKALSREPEDRFLSMANFEEAFRLAISQGRGSNIVGMLDQPTEVFEGLSKKIAGLIITARRSWQGGVLATFIVFATFAITWGFLTWRNGGRPIGNRDDTVSLAETGTAVSANLLATIDALHTADAQVVGILLAPSEIETIVAQTMEALIAIPDTSAGEVVIPTATASPTLTSTPTSTASPTFVWIPTPTKTATRRPPPPTHTPSPSHTPTMTPSSTPSPTFTPSPTPTPTSSPTSTPSPSPTPSPTQTATITPTSSLTPTMTPTVTNTPTQELPTDTPLVPSVTPTS
jgi:serine/threonine-protein kinase